MRKFAKKKYRRKEIIMRTYYYISDLNIVGKEEEFIPYIYDKIKGWVVDQSNILIDRILGYDDTEPEDSTYRLGNLNMLDRITEITEEEALKKIEEMK